jgi:hypothetical protein
LADLEAVVATLDGPIRGLIGHSWGGAVAGHTLHGSAFEKFAAASDRVLQ